MTSLFPRSASRLAWAFALALLLAGPALAAEFQRSFTLDSRELVLQNLVGQLTVRQAAGEDFLVTADVRGADAAEELIRFQIKEGSRGELLVVFPTDEHRKYVYPPLGQGSSNTITYIDRSEAGGSWLKKVFGGLSGKKITVQGKGNGLELWVDLVVQVPRGRVLHVEQSVGQIEAADLKADLDLDTGSGAITVQAIAGDVGIDTGSGEVRAFAIEGSLSVDTGSGEVVLQRIKGEKVLVDTGSGQVDLWEVECQQLVVDTGSGRVTGRGVDAPKISIDTGKGAVELQVISLADGRVSIDTGSGDINLLLPGDASARIQAETGSGRLHNQLTGATVELDERDELELLVGQGQAQVMLDTGSGSITIKH